MRPSPILRFMKKYKILDNVVYMDGYNHYKRHRDIPIHFTVNEAEKAALDDLTAVLGVKNLSDFIRRQVFGAFRNLTDSQKAQMAEVARWRATEDHPP